MTEEEYGAFVASKKKPGEAIKEALTPTQASAVHMALGVQGEAGELGDAVKKWAIYQKGLDRENVIEELGDMEFFMEGLRQDIGITREETLEQNRRKLDQRYKSGYTDAEAVARADKVSSQEDEFQTAQLIVDPNGFITGMMVEGIRMEARFLNDPFPSETPN